MRRFLSLDPPSTCQSPLLIGVLHLPACPGAPGYAGDFGALLDWVEADARSLLEGGADALILENFGDTPFFAERVPPETVAAMALALQRVQTVSEDLPLGVNVLRNDARSALALCATGAASFLRVNVHTGAMLTDQGLIQGKAAETVRTRGRLAAGAAILADVHVKHATPLGNQSLAEAAQDAFQRGAADALVISGARTGAQPAALDLTCLRDALPTAPLLIGSGLDAANAAQLLPLVNGAIVGTSLKHGGAVGEPVDVRRVRELKEIFCAHANG